MEAVREMTIESAEPIVFEAAVRDQLIERKGRLEEAARYTGDPFEFADLLDQVDAALERLSNGTYGKCVMCDGEVEAEPLLADPLAITSNTSKLLKSLKSSPLR